MGGNETQKRDEIRMGGEGRGGERKGGEGGERRRGEGKGGGIGGTPGVLSRLQPLFYTTAGWHSMPMEILEFFSFIFHYI